MTTTYDPAHPKYFVESDMRAELTRVYDLCHGCRLCFNLCPSFPTLFDAIDAHDGDVAALSNAEQDKVVDECYQCKLCYVKCPYVPPHEWDLDFPRLMMRSHAVTKAAGKEPARERVTDQFLGRTDLVGSASTMASPIVNKLIGTPGSFARKVMQATAGISAERLLPPYAKERFTTWFRRRAKSTISNPIGEVSVFPTCFVEYMEPAIGKDVVRVYEHNEIACSLPRGTKCCGAPWLHMGDVERFIEVAKRNVASLVKEVDAGRDIIVSQPTCSYVVKKDYPIYAPSLDAERVSAHTFDAAEYLVGKHRSDPEALKKDFPGKAPATISYHLACHLRAQNIGARARELFTLIGSKVTLVERCSGIDGTWGYREENFELSKKVARPLVRELKAASSETLCGDCHLANTAILEETESRPQHPLQIMARAYGLPED